MKREGPCSSDGAEKHTRKQYDQYLGILASFGMAQICKYSARYNQVPAGANRPLLEGNAAA